MNIKFYNLIPILLILTILCSLTAVNAADFLNETAVSDNDVGILTIENEVLQSGTGELNAINADDVEGISMEYGDSDDIIASSETGNSVLGDISITKLINDAKAGSTIVLEKDYTLNDLLFRKNNITIDGNGHTLSGAKLNRILTIEADYVTLKNINFVDAFNKRDKYGGAIYWNGQYGEIINCTFKDNEINISTKAINVYGGAIYFNKANNKVINSTFTNNAALYGNAIYFDYWGNVVDNCKFIDNKQITYDKDTSEIPSDSKLVYDWYRCIAGGAIYVNGNGNTIQNSVFQSNWASEGSAIYINKARNTITNCTFVSNREETNGAVYVDSSDCNILNSYFLDNKNNYYGTALSHIHSTSSVNVKDCWFGSDRFTTPDGLSGKVNLVNWYSLDLVDYTNGGDLNAMENLSAAFGSEKTFDLVFASNEGKIMSNVSNHLKFKALSYDEDDEYVEYGLSTLKYDGQSIKVIYAPKKQTKGVIELEIYGIGFKYTVKHIGGDTFSDLSRLCKGSGSNNVTLTHDYKYNSVSDSSSGISINDKNLIINADGHTLNGTGVSALFHVGIGVNLTIMNANIVECKKTFTNFGQITLINTTIENSKNSFVNYGNITLINSTVINDPGTLFNSKSVASLKAGNIKLINSTFIDIKRAIYEEISSRNKEKGKVVLDIENCTFQNIKELIFRAKSASIHNSEFDNITSKVNVYYGLDVTNNIFSNTDIDKSFFESKYNQINISNNWYGNTINNYGEKLVKSADVNNWIILNAEYTDDGTGIIVKLDEIYDTADKKIKSSDGLNTILNVTVNNQPKQEITLKNGEATIKLEDIGQNKHVLSIQYLSNEYTIELSKKTGSLSDLKKLIDNAADSVTLSKNYAYNESSDSLLAEGVVIDNSITVDGNDFTIDCAGKARAFLINADNVTIQNLKIINGYHEDRGGAIYWGTSNGSIINSIFENNTALKGGAIFQEEVLRISNSQFNNNKANDAGAVYRNAELILDNVTFNNNTPQDFEYLGGDDDDGDSSNDGQDTNANKIIKLKKPVKSILYSESSVQKIITKNNEITVYKYQLLLDTLNKIFNMDFTNGHILVYIDGKLVFNGTTTDDLFLLIYDLLQIIRGDHQIKVEFTDNKGNSKTYEENITFVE
ncbi:MAG: hypothetical protein IJP99_05080 [Methanobrevibacter sp.]|nr:hypothetical protein [Methanobrevibacter sp.]